MPVFAFGKNYTTGELLFKPKTEKEFTEDIIKAHAEQSDSMRKVANAIEKVTVFRDELEPTPYPSDANPREVGWTYMISKNDPQRAQLEEIILPLAQHRGMKEPEKYLKYNRGIDSTSMDWMDFLTKHYFRKGLTIKGKIPKYVLIVGGPDQIPFRFQSLLQCVAFVGRVAFDSLKDLRTYVKKVIRLETADEPAAKKEALFFATDGGKNDPTFYSRRNMIEPMAEWVKKELKYDTRALLGDEATKGNLMKSLKRSNPALVYTASHGLGAINESISIQKRFNGAICCQQQPGDKFLKTLLTAEDIPDDRPFLEGSIFFQFACFGFGTPKTSDYAHWMEEKSHSNKRDLISAIPKKLLAHPRGPIAYIGHLDTALLLGIVDENFQRMRRPWHPNVVPLKNAVEDFLLLRPAGLGMKDINDRFNLSGAAIANEMDLVKQGMTFWDKKFYNNFVVTWLTRNDAQNYMTFGDPAVRVRVGD